MLMDGYKLDQGVHSELMAATAVRSAKKTKPAPDQDMIDAADKFSSAKATKSQAEKDYEGAKSILLGFLGDATCKTLSDGRTVSKAVQEVPAEMTPRGATRRTIVSVSPKPAA